MKDIKNYIGILAIVIMSTTLFAQAPPPPNNGGTGSAGGTPVGGGAPVGSGILVLMAAAGAYAYTKLKNQTPDYKIEE